MRNEEEEENSEIESPLDKKGRSEVAVRELIGAVLGGADRDAGGSGPEDDKKTSSFSGPWKSKFSYEGEDDLNLAGLLNVLDGVVDSPGRIVVMTTTTRTNWIRRLSDPAESTSAFTWATCRRRRCAPWLSTTCWSSSPRR